MKWVQTNGLFEVIVTRGSLRKLNLIALRSEEVVQHEFNTMLNKKLAGMGQISQGMADGEYSRSAQQCRVKINNLKQKYRKIRDGNKISRNQRQE